jgi:hypothetical protein
MMTFWIRFWPEKRERIFLKMPARKMLAFDFMAKMIKATIAMRMNINIAILNKKPGPEYRGTGLL